MSDDPNDAEGKLTSANITGTVKPAKPGDLTAQLRKARQADARKKKAASKTSAADDNAAVNAKAQKTPQNKSQELIREHRSVVDSQAALDVTTQWFKQKDWQVFPFQRKAWSAWHDGASGLIHSPTGSGKTLAAWLGPVQQAITHNAPPTGLQVLWITPLRALASDTAEQLQQAADAMGAGIRVEIRTGDTSSALRTRQRSKPPFALITTPESLSVMLSYATARQDFSKLHTVIVDEWHELLGSKRGVQLQLCLAHVRGFVPNLRVWGLSATLGNLPDAMSALIGPDETGQLIRGVKPKSMLVESVLPADDCHFRWSGHLGLQLVDKVADVIATAGTTLVFTNTRSQAELWFQALLKHKPEWLGDIALHHGSLDHTVRHNVEQRLRDGSIICVVCTSSLDLGVDFSPVDQVMQIGSPKGIARLLQRAGRSGHRPGATSKIVCVPTHAFELIEITAVRNALASQQIESRQSPTRCLDVLSQHLVTIAMGSGFSVDQMLQEIRATTAYKDLGDNEWQWVLDFIIRGGQALNGYPQYHKVALINGKYKVSNKTIAQRHRMTIGTINSDAQMAVAYARGKRLGFTEESFIARLSPGDTFQFAGQLLELVRVRDMTAQVKKASRAKGTVARWGGTQMPISTELADAVLATLNDWQNIDLKSPELNAVNSMLQMQQKQSMIPGPDDFLLEFCHSKEGHSFFCYPFAGRLAHEGLAMLLAYRLTKQYSMTLTMQINDYGLELQCPEPFEEHFTPNKSTLIKLFSTDNLIDDILASINSGEIAKRQFRGIARIAGLVFSGYPGRSKSAKQVQASSGLIFDVFEQYDADNLLLEQAKREVLELQLEHKRILHCLDSLQSKRWQIKKPKTLTPLSFPLWAASLQSQTYSSESFQKRVNRMLAQLEEIATQSVRKVRGQ